MTFTVWPLRAFRREEAERQLRAAEQQQRLERLKAMCGAGSN